MSIITGLIILLVLLNIGFYVLNFFLRILRKRNSSAIFTAKKNTVELSSKVEELTAKIEKFKSENVSMNIYNDLLHKYNLLLDQYRRISARNKFLETRMTKLKEKLY
ncbi:Uncharacterised protein [Candidatus Tiddalikarchaeum anstoanum]|nr:Uncharacterised protein [Candidatus Tiddalikarchaeum anstoanum]